MMGLLQGLGKWSVLAWFDELGEEILNLLVNQTIGPLLWGLCDIFLVILDLFEWIFEAFAGTLEGGVTVQGQTVKGDLVLFLIQSDVVTQLFISILILSFILLLMFTVFAIVKNQYSEKQEPVSKIINGSFKALFMYLLVPVATVVCLLVGNIVLQAIDGGTNAANSTKASGMLFRTAAYNGNKLRDSSPSDAREDLQYWYDMNYLNVTTKNRIKDEVGITSSNIDTLEDYDDLYKIADIIDEQFANGDLATSKAWSFQVGGGLGLSGLGDSYWSYGTVCIFYDAFRLSYITIWVGGAFLIGAIGKICWGLIARLFKITIYYTISPAIMATFPIDNGKALGSWRSAMVQQTTSAYCAVAAVNILYSILPVFNNIDIGGGLGGCIIKLFIMIIAFKSTDDLIKTISGWFGTGDALSDGKAAKDAVKSTVKSAIDKTRSASKTAMGTFQGIKGGVEGAKTLGKNKVMGGLLGAWQGSGLAEKSGLDPAKWAKDYKDGVKKGTQYYEDLYTNYGTNAKANKSIFANKEENDALKKRWEAYAGEGATFNMKAALNGDAKEQKKAQKLVNMSDAADIILADEIADHQMKVKDNQKDAAFAGIVKEFDEANQEFVEATKSMDDEWEHIFGSGVNIKSEWKEMFLRGENLHNAKFDTQEEFDALMRAAKLMSDASIQRAQALQDAKNNAEKAFKQQQIIVENKMDTSEDFGKFMDSKGLFKDGNIVINEIKEVLLAVEKATSDLEKAGEELDIKKADVNYRKFTGDLHDNEQKILNKHNAANPKS